MNSLLLNFGSRIFASILIVLEVYNDVDWVSLSKWKFETFWFEKKYSVDILGKCFAKGCLTGCLKINYSRKSTRNLVPYLNKCGEPSEIPS